MAIYTGNNGRMYMARSLSSGLGGTYTQDIISGKSVTKGNSLIAVTVSGSGSGAVFRVDTAISAGATSRGCNFTVTNAGKSYSSTDRIYLARLVDNVVEKLTATFSVGSVLTLGVDSDTEINASDTYRIAKIRDWSYNSNSEVIETTALGDTTKSFAPSVTSGDGSATLMFYEDDLNQYGANATKDIYELVDILFPRNVPPRVIMSLVVDGGTYSADDITLLKSNFLFNAFITSASVSVSYGEVVTVATNFTVDGPLLDVPWKPGVARL